MTTTESPKLPFCPRSIEVAQLSAVAFVARLMSTVSDVMPRVTPSTPTKDPPVTVPCSASHERPVVSAAAGLSVASERVPLVMRSPTPPGAPTNRSLTVSENVESVAPVRTLAPIWAFTVCVSSVKPTVPETKPKMSMPTEPVTRETAVE